MPTATIVKKAPAKKVVAKKVVAKKVVAPPPPEPEPVVNIRKPPKVATATEVQTFAVGPNNNFLLCRDLGHNWRPWGAQWVPEDNLYNRTLRCTRCKTQRHQELSVRGEVVRSWYDYADGYQHKGLGRIEGEGRNALRLESIVRLAGDRSEIEE